jgi:hypothetical protein
MSIIPAPVITPVSWIVTSRKAWEFLVVFFISGICNKNVIYNLLFVGQLPVSEELDNRFISIKMWLCVCWMLQSECLQVKLQQLFSEICSVLHTGLGPLPSCVPDDCLHDLSLFCLLEPTFRISTMCLYEHQAAVLLTRIDSILVHKEMSLV